MGYSFPSAETAFYNSERLEKRRDYSLVFGPCQIDCVALAAAKIHALTGVIASGVDVDILCVMIGCNDLVAKNGQVLEEYPADLDTDLTVLASFMKNKAKQQLMVIGGPKSIWKYPERWDDYLQRMHDIMLIQGIPTVSAA